MERDPQRPRLHEKIDERSTEADVSAFRRLIGLFFFLWLSKNFRFAFLALNMYLAKLLLERFRVARRKAITFFAAHFAESSLREELAADRWSSCCIAAATDLSKQKEQRIFRAWARKSELNSSPGPAILLDMICDSCYLLSNSSTSNFFWSLHSQVDLTMAEALVGFL